MKIIRQTAKILAPTDGAEALRWIEQAGRNCYRSEGKITADSAPGFVRG
jgi:thymidylate synthase (FAD)